ncbi:stress-induced-phosphoprotein [Aureococcus anophagefferens]|uniref:Stress-induced-phosphoprotein n=1 Tax=Aureococcus anophagefferens TaxID=44056 RepID=A0ABR1FTL6_AURAN
MAATMAIARAKRAAKKRRLELQKLKEEKRMRDEEEVDMWLEKYDVNRDLSLQREELRKLLAELEPEAAPTDVAMDYVWTIAEALHKEHDPAEPETPHGGEIEEGVPRWKVRRVVARYREYLKRSKFLDEVFDRFDYDKSGKLEVEPPEIKGFLRAVVEGTLVVKGDEGTEEAVARTFKLQSLQRAKDKGILSERSLNAKWKNITGNTPSENVLDVDVTDGDVEFIIHNCDKNHDGAINRDEIFATISVWMGLLIDQKRREEARAAAAKKGSPGRELPLFETRKLAVPASGACSIM